MILLRCRENFLNSAHVVLFIGYPNVLHRHFLLYVVLLHVSVLGKRLVKVGEAVLLLGAFLALVSEQVLSRWDDGQWRVRRWQVYNRFLADWLHDQ